jgi:lipopolysaccharide transport system ATP-binding protein
VVVGGRVAALLELGSGFNPEFTGRENVFLNAAVLGLTQEQTRERFEAIAEFADIGAFLDQPVKTYSSGMLVRLAFAVQVQLDPDVLIIDEALAVGDALFQKRCFERLEELRGRGVTILFVSHDQESVRTLTDRAVLLDGGRCVCAGSSGEVVLAYRKLLHEQERRWFASHTQRAIESVRGKPKEPGTPAGVVESKNLSFGDLDAEIERVEVLDGTGAGATIFAPGETIRIAISAVLRKDVEHLNIAFRLRNKQGVKITSWGLLNEDIRVWHERGADAPSFWERTHKAGARVRAVFEFECRLGTNLYEVQAAVTQEPDRNYQKQRILHWRDEAAFFQVAQRASEYNFGGWFDLRPRTTVWTDSGAGVNTPATTIGTA